MCVEANKIQLSPGKWKTKAGKIIEIRRSWQILDDPWPWVTECSPDDMYFKHDGRDYTGGDPIVSKYVEPAPRCPITGPGVYKTVGGQEVTVTQEQWDKRTMPETTNSSNGYYWIDDGTKSRIEEPRNIACFLRPLPLPLCAITGPGEYQRRDGKCVGMTFYGGSTGDLWKDTADNRLYKPTGAHAFAETHRDIVKLIKLTPAEKSLCAPKVPGTYKTRGGEVAKLKIYDSGTPGEWSIKTNSGNYLIKPDGSHMFDHPQYDIVEFIAPTPKPLFAPTGEGWYERRDGKVVKLRKATYGNPDIAWRTEDRDYRASGLHYCGNTNVDIIGPASDPNPPAPTPQACSASPRGFAALEAYAKSRPYGVATLAICDHEYDTIMVRGGVVGRELSAIVEWITDYGRQKMPAKHASAKGRGATPDLAIDAALAKLNV